MSQTLIHKGCDGVIDLRTLSCSKCKKHWNSITFAFNNEMRFIGTVGPVSTNRYQWLTPENFASKLPKWPKWLRITSTLFVVIGIFFLVKFLVSVFGG